MRFSGIRRTKRRVDRMPQRNRCRRVAERRQCSRSPLSFAGCSEDRSAQITAVRAGNTVERLIGLREALAGQSCHSSVYLAGSVGSTGFIL